MIDVAGDPNDQCAPSDWPDIIISIPDTWFLSRWAGHRVAETLQKIATTEFPNYRIDFSVYRPSVEDASLYVRHSAATDKREGRAKEPAFVEIAEALTKTTIQVFAQQESASIGAFRERLDRCTQGLAEFAGRPKVLSEFMTDVAELYGFVVETDLAMLMAADHFGRAARNEPTAMHRFSRGTLQSGTTMPVAHHERTGAELAARLSHSGINRILRNRAVVIYLFELWENKYRGALEAETRKGRINSDLFGDLRIYRNKAAHGAAKLDRSTKILRLVEMGKSIDLIDEIDALFVAVVNELNRLAKECFGIETHFSLGVAANVFPIARGQEWRDDRHLG